MRPIADDSFTVQLRFDVRNGVADLKGLANQIAEVNRDLKDPGLQQAEKNLAKFGNTAKASTQSLSTTRFALQSTAVAAAALGVAMVGLAVLPVKTSIEFERAFANVARTVQGATKATKDALISLSTQLPVTFKDLTEIAALGGQLGIGNSGIIEFTKTVAELTATTNLSAEAAGTALGRFESFGLIKSDQFENLASAILKVGVNSVATETQIVTIATRIAGIAKVAGLTADQIVGLSGALASVGVQPYAAQGTVTRLFTTIGGAVSTGSDQLKEFAKIAGVTSDQFAAAYGTSKFGPIFAKFIENLGNTAKNGKDVNGVLGDLNISGSTDIRVLTQLAAASGTVKQAFSDAASGFADTSTLTNQYGKIADTTASKITELGNSFKAFLDSIGSASGGIVGVFADGLNDILKNVTALNKTTGGQIFVGIVTVLTLLAGLTLLVAAGFLKGTASVIGLITAMRGLNAETSATTGLFGTLIAELAVTGPAGVKAAAGLSMVGKALPILGVAAGVLALTGLAGALLAAGDSAVNNTIKFNNTTEALKAFNKQASLAVKNSPDSPIGPATSNRAKILSSTTGANQGFGSALSGVPGIGQLGGELTGFTAATASIKKIDAAMADLVQNGHADTAAKEFDKWRAASKELGLTQADVAAKFPQYGAAIAKQAKAAEAAANANASFSLGLASQKDIVKTLTDLTGLNAKEQDKFAQSYAKSVSSLTDFNSVISQVQDHLKDTKKGYDGSSVSLAQFTSQLETNNSKQQAFASNLVQISSKYGSDAANVFIQAGYSAVNASILQQLVDATPAQAAAYIKAQQDAATLASNATAQALLASGHIVTASGAAIGQDTADAIAQGLALGIPIDQLMNDLGLKFQAAAVAAPQPKFTVQIDATAAQNTIDRFISANNRRTINIIGTAQPSQARANGGAIFGPGSGTSDSIPARLSNGEYVIRAASVRKYGMGMFDALNRGVAKFAQGGPVRGYASGGPVASSSGMGVMELGPMSLGAIRSIAQQEVLAVLDPVSVARLANGGNRILNNSGAQR